MMIGITGMMGAGKSTVSAILGKLGADVLDADALSRALTAPGGEALPAIAQAFGAGVFDGAVLNRKRLAEFVFADCAALQTLNQIIHPLVIAQTEHAHKQIMQKNPTALVVLDAPLLIEARMHQTVDSVWLVAAEQEICIKRCMVRDGMSAEQVVHRLDQQMPFAQKRRFAHVILYNDAGIKELEEQVLGQSIIRQWKHSRGET